MAARRETGEQGEALYQPRSLEALIIISFDRDHTLAWGNPPGPITADHLRRVKELGHTIGTGGGAGGEEQRAQWLANGIEPDFALSKGELVDLPRRFPGQAFVHVDNDPVAIEGFRVVTPEGFLQEFLQ